MVKAVTAEEVEKMNGQDDVVLVDVLPEDSFRKKHIPGAINIPVEARDFEMMMRQQVPNRRSRVIVYCTDRDCEASPRAAKALEELGYENVLEFTEGLAGWKQAGNVFEGEKQQIRADVSRS